MSDKNSESFWDNLRREIKAIGTDTRASDMRRFKAYMIDRVFAMEQGAKIREALLKSQEEKLQAAEERERILREAVEACAHIGVDCGYGEYTVEWGIGKARQALERVKRGGE